MSNKFSEDVAFAEFATGAGTVTTNRAVNCVVTRTADGDYIVTLGDPIANANMSVDVDCSSGAAAGAGTARVVNVTSTSDTVKVVQVRDDAGAFALVASLRIYFKRILAF